MKFIVSCFPVSVRTRTTRRSLFVCVCIPFMEHLISCASKTTTDRDIDDTPTIILSIYYYSHRCPIRVPPELQNHNNNKTHFFFFVFLIMHGRPKLIARINSWLQNFISILFYTISCNAKELVYTRLSVDATK